MEPAHSVQHLNSQSPITLSDLKIIASSLVCVLAKTFGPRGQTTLLVSSTGQTSIVKEGLETILSLHLAHPVARCIQQAVKNLISIYGDGCKSMVIYFNALVCALESEMTKQSVSDSGAGSAVKNEITKTLRTFVVHHLPKVLFNVEHYVSVEMREAVKKKDNSWILYNVIRTYLNGCIPHLAIHPVANLIVHYFNDNMGKCDMLDYENSLKWFSSCVFVSANKSFSASRVETGIFIQRPLLHIRTEISSVTMICMLCTFDGLLSSKEDDDKGICLLKNPAKILRHRQWVAEKFFSVLRDKNVSLVICSSKVPSYVLQMCQNHGMAVIDCVDESDIDFICYISGKCPVTSCFEDLSCNCLMNVSSCSQLIEGPNTYSKLILMGDLCWRPRSIFICAPSESLGKQLKKAMVNSMTIISHLMRDPTRCKVNVDVGGDDQLVFGTLVCGGGYFEMLVCQFLLDYSKDCPPSQRWCCHVLAEMLAAVPQVLLTNLSSHHNNKKRTEMLTLKIMREKVKDKTMCAFEVNGQLCNPVNSGVIEVWGIKIGAFYSALYMALSLLNVDMILSVSKPVKPP